MNKNRLLTDMTTGSPIKLIISFALPLFVGNIFQQIYSITDTIICGYNLGTQAIAAIGATSSLALLILSFSIGMNNGYALVLTRAFGSHDVKKMRSCLSGMLILNSASAVILTTGSLAFLKPLLRVLNTPESIFDLSYTYIFIIYAGMAGTIFYNMTSNILRSMGNSRTPLVFLILTSILNVVLDLFFILVLKTGIGGVALATILSQILSAVLCGVFIFRNYKDFLPHRSDFHLSKSILADLLSNGFAMALMVCVVNLGSVIFQSSANNLGETLITAHTAARRLISILMDPLNTVAIAFSIFSGQNFGACKYDRIRATLRKVLLIELCWTVFCVWITYVFGAGLISLTTGTTDAYIIENAVLSLRIHTPLYFSLGTLFVLRMMMQAIGRKMIPIVSSLIELGIKVLSAFYLIPHLGFLGICITEPLSWLLMSIFLLIAYFSSRSFKAPSLCK